MEKIDRVLRRTFEKLGLEERIEEGQLLENWENLVGKEIARHTQPVGIKKKKLFVKVDSSTWVYELSTHHKEEILDRLKQASKKFLIADIYFKIGKLEKN